MIAPCFTTSLAFFEMGVPRTAWTELPRFVQAIVVLAGKVCCHRVQGGVWIFVAVDMQSGVGLPCLALAMR